jgi:hypothetical protein
MDTFKDKRVLDSLYESGNPPWEVWRNSNPKRKEMQLVGGKRLVDGEA